MIDQKLLQDSEFIADLNLSQLRLIKDGELDWFMLIPRKENLKEWIDLTKEEQFQLSEEIDYVSRILKEHADPDKINVANLGNVVSQLHIHVLARYNTDRAWPGPIWGTQTHQKLDQKRVTFWQDIVNSSQYQQ
jgi:diadenosine tetraphosphate (Ap4A) HIT family hydrolase